MDLIKIALGGWIGLNNTVESFTINKEYRYKCQNICEKPSTPEELVAVLKYDNVSDDDIQKIKQNMIKDKLFYNAFNPTHIDPRTQEILRTLSLANGTTNATKCRLFYSNSKYIYEYVPTNCIHKFNPESPILNTYDKKTYIFMESTWTPIAGLTPTFIYKLENTKYIFVIFGFGSVLSYNNLLNLINVELITIFIATVLLKYLSDDYFVVLCGHSAGMVNAFFVADVLYHSAIADSYIISRIKTYITKYANEVDNFNIKFSAVLTELQNTIDDADKSIIKYKKELVDLESKFANQLAGCKNGATIEKLFLSIKYDNELDDDNNDNLVEQIDELSSECKNKKIILKMVNKKSHLVRSLYMDSFTKNYNSPGGKEYIFAMNELHKSNTNNKEILESLKQFNTLMNSDKLKQISDKIFICGSGGYPCFGNGLINYSALKTFYHGRILHFKLPKDYYTSANLDRMGNIYRSDFIELYDENIKFYTVADLIKIQQSTDLNSMFDAMTKSDTKENHEWSVYVKFLEKIGHNNELIQLICDQYHITDLSENMLYGGIYYQKYMKYKKKYLDLKYGRRK